MYQEMTLNLGLQVGLKLVGADSSAASRGYAPRLPALPSSLCHTQPTSWPLCLTLPHPPLPSSKPLLSAHCVSTPQFQPNTRDKGLISQKPRLPLILYTVCQQGKHTARPLSPISSTRPCPDYPWHLGSWGLGTGDINCSNIEKQRKGFLFKTACCHTCR